MTAHRPGAVAFVTPAGRVTVADRVTGRCERHHLLVEKATSVTFDRAPRGEQLWRNVDEHPRAATDVAVVSTFKNSSQK